MDVLNRLVESGNTVLVIEHNLDVIRNADWVIDLGPEGGERGGEIVAEGPPAEIAKSKRFCKISSVVGLHIRSEQTCHHLP